MFHGRITDILTLFNNICAAFSLMHNRSWQKFAISTFFNSHLPFSHDYCNCLTLNPTKATDPEQLGLKSKILLNSVVMSNFSYCPLIWLFCSKVAKNEINRTHKLALRTLYKDYASTFEELLDRGDAKTTHKKNLQNLMVEIYKSMNHLNPEYMWDFFVKKDVPYNLRTKERCKLPSVSSQRY